MTPLTVQRVDFGVGSEQEAGGEARRYFMGRGARAEDPRTGAGTPRIKDVMRGEIDLFIAAWLARPPGEQPVNS